MSHSLADKAYGLIRADVVSCVFAPGQQVVQAALAERYHLGTTPVRDALQRLVQEGLVESLPRFGYVIRPITVTYLQEMYEMRSILEPIAARAAAIRASDEMLKAITTAADFTFTQRDRAGYARFLARNAEFHRSIASAAGNERLAKTIYGLLDELMRFSLLTVKYRDSEASSREGHLALAEALCARDADTAERTARDHVASAHRLSLDLFPLSLGSSLERQPTQMIVPAPTESVDRSAAPSACPQGQSANTVLSDPTLMAECGLWGGARFRT